MTASSSRRQVGLALLFLAPNLLGFLTFTLGPIVLSLAGSFTTWSLRPSVPLRFIGLRNYIDLFTDPNFYFYAYNTLYLLLALPFSIAGSLALAVLISGKLQKKGPRPWRIAVVAAGIALLASGALFFSGSPSLAVVTAALGLVAAIGIGCGSVGYRTLYYLPHFTAGAGTILLWMQLYNPNFGLIDQGLAALGHVFGIPIDPPRWLSSTRSLLGFLPLPASFNNGGFGIGARESILIMGLWASVGGNNMILFLAGLSNISPELYEAADIDGASPWQRFRHITWPQLMPTTFFIVVMGFVQGLQGGFEQARLMTLGGPAGTTTTLSYYIYTQGFERLDLGYGAAVAWVLFLAMMAATWANWRFGNKEID